MPNTEVKPFSADGTWLETTRESRSLPDSIRKTLSRCWAFSHSCAIIFCVGFLMEGAAMQKDWLFQAEGYGSASRIPEGTNQISGWTDDALCDQSMTGGYNDDQ